MGVAFLNLLKTARPTLESWKQKNGLKPEFEIGAAFGRNRAEVSAEEHLILRQASTEHAGTESADQKFYRILSRYQFGKLRAIWESAKGANITNVSLDEVVTNSATYAESLGRLGHTVVLDETLDYQAYYSRVGQEGGIRAVLPFHEIATHVTHSTVITLDGKVLTTAGAIKAFETQFKDLRKQLSA